MLMNQDDSELALRHYRASCIKIFFLRFTPLTRFLLSWCQGSQRGESSTFDNHLIFIGKFYHKVETHISPDSGENTEIGLRRAACSLYQLFISTWLSQNVEPEFAQNKSPHPMNAGLNYCWRLIWPQQDLLQVRFQL